MANDKKKKKKKGGSKFLLLLVLVGAGCGFGYFQVGKHNDQLVKDQQAAAAALGPKLTSSEKKPTPEALTSLQAEATAIVERKLLGPPFVHKKEQTAGLEEARKRARYVLLLTYCVAGDAAKAKAFKDAAHGAPSPGSSAVLQAMLKELAEEEDKDDLEELGEEFWEGLKKRAGK